MTSVQTFTRRAPPLELLERYLAAPLTPLSPRDERYTTEKTMGWCLERALLERFDLDVCACRESHKARDWYGLDHPRGPRDGLELPWPGHSFGNVPFSQWGHWLATAWMRFSCDPGFKSHSMILPNDRTEQAPWHDLVEPFRDGRSPWLTTWYMRDRTRYSQPGLKGRTMAGSPFFSSVLLVWSRSRRVLAWSRAGAPVGRLPDASPHGYPRFPPMRWASPAQRST